MIAQIETTNFCNHRCWYCQNAHYKPPPHKIMDLNLFDCILREISRTFSMDNLNIISFAAYNEPTLDPYFKERLCMLTELGFQYWFISNGSHMTPALVEFIIREQIAVYAFLFNVPALDPAEFHAAVHVPAEHINTIRENLIIFLKHPIAKHEPKATVRNRQFYNSFLISACFVFGLSSFRFYYLYL